MFVVAFKTPSFSTLRFTPCFKKIAPLRNVPFGTTTTPPPAAAHLSMTAWMAFVFTVLASAMAPKSEMTKRFGALAPVCAALEIASRIAGSVEMNFILLISPRRGARSRRAGGNAESLGWIGVRRVERPVVFHNVPREIQLVRLNAFHDALRQLIRSVGAVVSGVAAARESQWRFLRSQRLVESDAHLRKIDQGNVLFL